MYKQNPSWIFKTIQFRQFGLFGKAKLTRLKSSFASMFINAAGDFRARHVTIRARSPVHFARLSLSGKRDCS